MPDFSVILQSNQVRSLVQDNLLERAFHDALFPRLMFRGEAAPVVWPAGVGDRQIFSAPGLIPVDARPLTPGTDPVPVTYSVEQWEAQLQQYSSTIDTHMPTSMVAIANLFMRNAQQLGLQASQTINRVVRNRMYAAALSGWTVADGTAGSSVTIRVKRLNGFTRARNPSLSAGSQVRYDLVSTSNPLAITVVASARNVIAFTPDTVGDEYGPGTITLDVAIAVTDRDPIFSVDRTSMVRVGGGNSVDSIGSGDIPTLSDIRSAVARFRQMNVPEHPDGRFHAHLDPMSEAKIFADAEFQRLLTALPDYYMYRQFAVGELLGTVFFRNSECPTADTVVGGSTATFDPRDPFVGELYHNGVAATGTQIHRILFTAQQGIFEYYSDLSQLMTEAGLAGVTADPRIVNNGIEIMSERIQLIIRQPLNRLQDQVATSWKFIGDWPIRTDGAVGDAARYKRFLTIEHGA